MSVYLPQEDARPGTLVRVDRFIPRVGSPDQIAENDAALILAYPGEKGAYNGFVNAVILSGPLSGEEHQLNVYYLRPLKK